MTCCVKMPRGSSGLRAGRQNRADSARELPLRGWLEQLGRLAALPFLLRGRHPMFCGDSGAMEERDVAGEINTTGLLSPTLTCAGLRKRMIAAAARKTSARQRRRIFLLIDLARLRGVGAFLFIPALSPAIGSSNANVERSRALFLMKAQRTAPLSPPIATVYGNRIREEEGK